MSSKIAERALKLGFIGIGFSSPRRPLYFDEFKTWLSAGKNAGMSWMEKNLHLREDPSLLLKDCRTVISLAYPYSSSKPSTPDGFSVSRYSEPDKEDYHKRLRSLCRELSRFIKEIYSGCDTRICVDSAPLMERSFACSSGLGFIGKNNMLILPGFGSYLYLAEILTTERVEFASSGPAENLCGTCRLCLEACPAGALEKPFSLNASKCLSYRTIERRDPVDEETGKKMGNCFFGCDRCQEACPFNAQKSSENVSLPSTEELLSMDIKSFEKKIGNTALSRAGLVKIKENIEAVKLWGKPLSDPG